MSTVTENLAQARMERALRAVREFNKMTVGMTTTVRALTGKPSMRVLPTSGVPYTDGKNVYMRVPIELGDELQHVRGDCDKRDREGVQKCPACKRREELIVTLYHEIGHNVYDSFQSIPEDEAERIIKDVLKKVAKTHGDKAGDRARAALDRIFNVRPLTFGDLAQVISPYAPMLFNALEDGRINCHTMRVREGTRAMFAAQTANIFEHGTEMPDGKVQRWRDASPNSQVIVGLLCKIMGYDVSTWLAPEVAADLESPSLAEFIREVPYMPDARGTYELLFPVLSALKDLGYCLDQYDPEPDDEDTGGDSDETGESDDSDSDESASGSEAGDDSDDEDEADESADGAGDEGQPDGADDESESDEADGDEEEAGSADGGEDEPESDGDESASDDDGDQPDDSEDDADSDGGSSGEGDESEEDDAEADDLSDGGSDTESEEMDPDGDGEDSSDSSTSGVGGGSAEPDDYEDDYEDDDDYDDEEVQDEDEPDLPPEDIEEVRRIVNAARGHGSENDEESDDEKREDEVAAFDLDRAITNGEAVETPTAGLGKVNVYRPGEHMERVDVWRDEVELGAYGREIMDAPEQVMAPALGHLRRVFSENRKGKVERNLKRGKVDTGALGKRAPFQDPRMMRRKTLPGKRSYFVLIGLDISSSNIYGHTMPLARSAVAAQAALLSRIGVEFAIYAHSGMMVETPAAVMEVTGQWATTNAEIFLIKDRTEPWSQTVKDRLEKIRPFGGNLDGHTIQYYRMMLDKVTNVTHKVLMYYTDGEMPASNYEEELSVLLEELQTMKVRRYTVAGVGITSNSPTQYGLDTVRLDDISEVPRVVKHLERLLG